MARVHADGRCGYALTLKGGDVYCRSRYAYTDGLYFITREVTGLKSPPEFYACTRVLSAAMHIARQCCTEWHGYASVLDKTRTLSGTITPRRAPSVANGNAAIRSIGGIK